MADAKEIKTRIAGVQATHKITSAMYLISSTKLRRARARLEDTRPYFDALRGEIKRVFRSVEDIESPYLFNDGDSGADSGSWGCLVITSDKGLAGSYNHNVLRRAEELLEKHPDCHLYVVGEFGRRYFRRKNVETVTDFSCSAREPSIGLAREIAGILLDAYRSGRLTRLYIIYSDMENSLTVRTMATRLLPLHKDHFAQPDFEKSVEQPFDFLPSPGAVLDTVVPAYISGYIYSALVDSFCCEQNERMRAMDSANRNADKLLDQLSLEYNLMRQNAITREITELSAGAGAKRRNDAKERST